MKWIRTALAIAIAALAVTTVAAQSGGITVIVTDNEGMELPGATVTISHETGFVKTSASLTDRNGVAVFPVLRPGDGYWLEIAFPGFNTIRQGPMKVRISENINLPIQMMEEFQERVKVVAETEVIDLDQTSQTTRFSENFISDLPVPGRFYQNVLTMAPGVQDADGDGNPNVHGSRSRDFQAVVSGVSNVDPLTGQWMSRINPNSIEEMEVITAGAGVEFGRAQGGFARIIQKQGSNTHEGVAEFYYRSSKLDGNGANNTSGVTDADYDWYQPSLQLSGPLIKDTLWYRASLESRDIGIPIQTSAGVVTQDVKDKTNDFQVTWQVSPRNKLALQYRQDPRSVTNLLVSSRRDSRSALAQDRETQTTTMIWTAPYSPKVLVESTVSWQDLGNQLFPNTQGELNACVGASSFISGAQCFDIDKGAVSGSYFQTLSDHRQRLSVKGKATVYGGRFWGMNHQFKLGISAENERYYRDLNRGPTLTYYLSQSDTAEPGQPPDLIQTGQAILTLSVPEEDSVEATGSNWGFYVEDQFKPRQNLTLTVGARVDQEEIDSEGRRLFDPQAEFDAYQADLLEYVAGQANPSFTGIPFEVAAPARNKNFTAYEDYASFTALLTSKVCVGDDAAKCTSDLISAINTLATDQKQLNNTRKIENIHNVNTNFSPYLSVAWDPYSNGKMAIKASAGRHYNNIPLIIPLAEIEPAQTTLLYEIALDTGTPTLKNGVNPAVNVSMIDPDLKTPYQDEWTISFERELWAETSLNVTYINRKFEDQIQDKNVNVNVGDWGQCVRQVDPQSVALKERWGVGTLIDEYSGQPYEDTDPGPGDGRIDDCVGHTELHRGQDDQGQLEVGTIESPDGLSDLYKLNPFWGDIFVIGNFNRIDYEAFVFELIRRQYRSWELQGSYTYSKAEGDGEDFFQGFDDDPSIPLEDLSGYQSYDQRHVVKVNATTITPWGIRAGTSVSWQSGLPYSLQWNQNALDVLPPSTLGVGLTGARARFTYPTESRNDQRNSSYWNVDLKATKEFNLARGMNLQLSAEVFNVLADDTYIVYNGDQERGVQVNGVNEAFRRFGRSWQLGMKLAF